MMNGDKNHSSSGERVVGADDACIDAPKDDPTLAQQLLKHAGTVNDLPADMASRHDHYIHKTPRRPS